MTQYHSQHPQRARLLIVEDDTIQQTVLAAALSSHGYVVEVATSGLDAIRAVRESGCDLMLIDYHIPEIDGLATARLVRELTGEAGCPAIVALTVSPDNLAETEAISGRAFDGILAKPIRLADLLSVVERCLNDAPNRETRRDAEAALAQQRWDEYDTAPTQSVQLGGRPMPPRILVVEDDDLQKSVLRAALTSRGYHVDGAADGMRAIQMIRAGGYDLALIDYQLPEIDGVVISRLILDLMSEVVRPRMVALTSAPDRLGGALEGIGSSFDEIVAKSADLCGLLAVVARQLRSAPNPATRRAAAAVYTPAITERGK
jgi:two-component system sensor histidine kinase/response regulator